MHYGILYVLLAYPRHHPPLPPAAAAATACSGSRGLTGLWRTWPSSWTPSWSFLSMTGPRWTVKARPCCPPGSTLAPSACGTSSTASGKHRPRSSRWVGACVGGGRACLAAVGGGVGGWGGCFGSAGFKGVGCTAFYTSCTAVHIHVKVHPSYTAATPAAATAILNLTPCYCH